MNQYMRNYLFSLVFIVVMASALYYASTKMEKKTFDWRKSTFSTIETPASKFASLKQYFDSNRGCSVFELEPDMPEYEGVGIDLRGGVLCISEIAPKLDYAFYIHTDGNTGTPIGIEYSEKNNESNSRYIKLGEIEHPFDKDFITYLDLNFDGYLDMLVTQSTGATGTVSYLAYLFDPRNSDFVEREDFAIVNVIPDAKTKTLRSAMTLGAAGMEYVTRLYRVENNKPIIVEEVEQRRANNEASSFVKVTRRLVKGALQQVSSEPVTL